MENLLNYINESANKNFAEKIYNELKTYFNQTKKTYIRRPGSYSSKVNEQTQNIVGELFYNILSLCLDEEKFDDYENYQNWSVGILDALERINNEQE